MTHIQAEPLSQEELEFFHNSEFFSYKWTHLFVFKSVIWERILDTQSRFDQQLRKPNHIMHTICDDRVLVWFKLGNQDKGVKNIPLHSMAGAALIVEFADGIFGPAKFIKYRSNPFHEVDLDTIQVRERLRQELLAITRLR